MPSGQLHLFVRSPGIACNSGCLNPGSAQRKLVLNNAPNGDLTACPEPVEGIPYERNRLIRYKCNCPNHAVER